MIVHLDDALRTSATGLSLAWENQWRMIEEDISILMHEYVASFIIAQSLCDQYPGRVILEGSIKKFFCNSIMRTKHNSNIPLHMQEGKIDIVICDTQHIIPKCLIEVKRNYDNGTLLYGKIKKDVSRIAYLIQRTTLPNVFGFSIFPLIVTPDDSNPNDYSESFCCYKKNLFSLIQELRCNHRNINFRLRRYDAKRFIRPLVIEESYGDGTTELLWDKNGFYMIPVAISVKRTNLGKAPSLQPA